MNPVPKLRLLLVAALAAGVALLDEAAALAAVVTWDGDAGDGLWITKENWSGNELPGVGDDVIIGAAFGVNHTASTHTIRSLTVDGSLTILGGLLEFTQASQINGTLTMGALQDFPGGTLHGTGPLTIATPLNWFGGTMSGSGVTDANAGVSFSGQFGKTINGRTFNNNGAAAWSGTGNIGLGINSRFNNNGPFNAATDADFVHTGGGTQGFFNVGSFTKSSGAGETSFVNGVPFHNSGAVAVQMGTLSLAGGGTSTGRFDVVSGSFVVFPTGIDHTLDGATFTGSGTARVTGGGGVTINGTVRATNFDMAGRDLAGPGTLEVSGAFRWTGTGTMSGAGATNANGTMEINSAAGVILTQRTLNNRGMATWMGTGNIGIGGGATIHNHAGATFEVRNDQHFGVIGFADGAFVNVGTFKKTFVGKSGGGGTTHVASGVRFDNTGTVQIEAGSLALSGGGTSSGNFTMAANTSVRLSGGTHNLNGAVFQGDGTGVVAGGTATVSGTVTASRFSIVGGTVNGPGTLAVNFLLTWSGGTLAGNGTVNSTQTMSIEGSALKTLTTRRINTSGVAAWSGGNLQMGAGAVISNLVGGTFDAEGQSVLHGGGADARFDNFGTFRKSSLGVTRFGPGVAFNNGGTVLLGGAAIIGTLELAGGGFSVGTFTLESGSLKFTGGIHELSGATLAGDGSAILDGGTVRVSGTVNADSFHIVSGNLDGAGTLVAQFLPWSGGTMLGTGVTRVRNILNIHGAASKSLRFRRLEIASDAGWSDTGNILLAAGARLVVLSGATFTVQNDRMVVYDGGVPPAIENMGTFTKSAGNGMTTLGVSLANTGRIRAQSGTMNFAAGLNQTAGQTLLVGGNIAGAINIVGGELLGTGLVNGQVFNGGAVKPNKSPGTIQIVGDYAQGASGLYEAEIAGIGAGQFDQLTVSGNATLAGALNIVLLNGFQPIVGDSFPILTYGSVTGAFDTVDVLGLDGARTFEVRYGPTGLMLVTQGAAGSSDLSVTKTHSPDAPPVGHDLTYTITVSNIGPDAATGVTAGDGLPPEVTFVSAIASQGGCVGTSVVTCNLGSLSSGSQATVTIIVRPTATGMITNTVSVASDQSDPAPGNNQATDVVSMTGSNGPFAFYTLTPCRVLDTRLPDGPLGGPALAANTDRSFALAGACGIPPTAKAVSANVTITQPASQGHLSLYPAGSGLPLVSSINFGAGQTRANNATLPLSAAGAITVRSVLIGGDVHFILDVNGYYE